MTDINTAAQALAGDWVKLNSKADGFVEGRVLAFEQRPMTFEGAPVNSRKTGQQRTEWVLTVQDDDNQVVKFSLKEAGQRAVAEAIKASGQPAKNGDRLKIWVAADKASDREQATYKAKWTPDASPLGIPDSGNVAVAEEEEDEEPF